MGRVVWCPIENEAFTNAAGTSDIFELTAVGNKIRLLGWRFESDEVSAESLRIRLVRRTTQGTGGTPGVEVLNDTDDGAITGVCLFDVTTTQGTIGDIIANYRWEQLGPLGEIYTPEMAPKIDPGNAETLSLFLAAAPTTDTNLSGYVCWEEL